MTITTDDVRKFATNAKMRTFANLFDEWLESHDAEGAKTYLEPIAKPSQYKRCTSVRFCMPKYNGCE